MQPQELSKQIKKHIADRYFSNHPFMKLFYNGKLTPQQVRGWIINRYYYQRQIPVKDSIILSNITEPVSRKMWLQRMMKREGLGAYRGDVEGWAKFAEAAGIANTTLEKMNILPGVRMAVDAYINFVRTVSWIEGASASLSELFALDELPKRITALKNHYNWIDQRGVEFFLERLSYIREDVDLVLELVAPHIRSREMLKKCLRAAAFNCDVHWSMLDAIYMGYVVSKKL